MKTIRAMNDSAKPVFPGTCYTEAWCAVRSGNDGGIDVDDTKITTALFRRTDTPLASVLNDMFDGVYIVDKDRHILFWNRAAETLTGFAAGDVCGRWCGDNILDHIDARGNYLCKTECPLTHVFRTGCPVELKVYPRTQSGRRFPTVTHAAPIHDESGEIVAAVEVFRDATRDEEFRLLQEKFNRLIAQYVSSATFEEVMAQARGSSAAGSSSRNMSVMYLDVVGFTSFSEGHRPEEAVQMLNDVFGMCDIITTECHGDVDKFIGDCIMAVFIDANDAVEAAKRVLQALARMNDWRLNENKPPIAVRIGINSGLVIQGEVGTPHRRDLTVIGDVVNTAARLQQLAHINGICISEAAASRLKNLDDFERGGMVLVRGKSEGILVDHSQTRDTPSMA